MKRRDFVKISTVAGVTLFLPAHLLAQVLSRAWFLCPYKRLVGADHPTRYCAMDDFTSQIRADGGAWSETEILGNRAIVRVRASTTTLSTIAATATFRRIPLTLLNDLLASLTSAQRAAIRNEILDAGYTISEIDAALPNLAAATLGDVLRFMTTRRKKPRYDAATDAILLDGPNQPCKSVDSVAAEIL